MVSVSPTFKAMLIPKNYEDTHAPADEEEKEEGE